MIKLGLATDVSQAKLVDYTFGDTTYTDAELDAIDGVYDASLLDLDKATGHLLESLKERGLLDNTIVIITSDHGENLGEHGHFEHRFVLYEPLIHVPLIVRYPSGVKPGRVASETSNLRIFATVLELLGLEGPDTPYERDSLLNGESGQAFSEIAGAEPTWTNKVKKRYPDADWAKLRRSYRSVSEEGWKFIRASDGERELFYDLEQDPGELENMVTSREEKGAVFGRDAVRPCGQYAEI